MSQYNWNAKKEKIVMEMLEHWRSYSSWSWPVAMVGCYEDAGALDEP